MKLVDVAEFYAERGGGVRTYINQKLSVGRELGHEVVVVAPGPESKEEARLGGRIIWVKGPPLPPDPRYYILWRQQEVHRILDRERPDVVEGSSPWTGGWFVARWQGKALKVFPFHQDPVAVYPQTLLGKRLGHDRVDRMFGWYWAYLRALSGRFDVTLVSGHWLARKLERFGLQRPIAVPFGIDKARFSPSKRDPATRADWLGKCGVDPSASLLVTISRFHPEKRLHTVLRAFEIARRARPMGLVIFGDGFMAPLVRRWAARTEGVHLAGFLRDRDGLSTALASADLMLHGSSAETYGLVIAEGICSGLPIVAPNVGGAADLTTPDSGLTYAPGDAAGAAEAILGLLQRPRAELQAGCAEVAENKIHTMHQHFVELFALYEKLLRER